MENEPITRQEQLLNAIAQGKATDIKPITREEMFLAKAAGQDVETPTPITRREMFLSQISGGGSGGGGSSDNFPIGDGNTHIWITLNAGRTSPVLGVCPNGTVTVDWGDGTEPDVLTGTSTSTVQWTPTHNYAKPGDYVITLTVDGEVCISGSYSDSRILRHSSIEDSRDETYRGSVRKAEVAGSTTVIYTSAFETCYSLESVVITDGAMSIGYYAFKNCYSLASVVIPDSVTNIGNCAFLNCYSLVSVVIPKGITYFGTDAFANCHGVRYYDFTTHTQVPAMSDTSAFRGISADCEIRVPAALYDEWIAATNWATYASKIVAV